MSTQIDVSALPKLFVGQPDGAAPETPLEFKPVTRDGRVSAMMHSLYSTKETGADGPAAAIMHYMPGATAAPHEHGGYELIFVLSGELETEEGTFGPNSLIVMPPGSIHAPKSPKGCVGLVVWEQPVKPA